VLAHPSLSLLSITPNPQSFSFLHLILRKMRFAHALACITALTSSLVAAAPNTGGKAVRPDSAALACGTVENVDPAVEKVV
jgi:hypothetical protein